MDYKRYIGDPDLNTSETQLTSTAQAQHHNDDFWFNDQRTWAYHEITITANANETFDWQASWDHWGEASGNLRVSAFVE